MAAAATAGAPDGRSRKFFGQVTFTPSKRGYEQAEVDAFLEQAGHAIERLLQRLREAEATADDARLQIESAEQRAQQAEQQRSGQHADDDLIQRTLTLAERTAVAAVADAKRRAEEILQAANLEAADLFGLERSKLEGERLRLADERQQLETLRLAVAAETHSLERVRANLRERVAMVADELREVADRPDLLGYHLATPATPTTSQPAPDQPVPAEPAADAVAAAPAREALAPPQPAPGPESSVAPPQSAPGSSVAAPAPSPAVPPPAGSERPEVAAPPPPAPLPAPTPPAAEPPLMAPSVAVSAEDAAPQAAPASPAPTPEPVAVPAEVRAEVPPGWPYAPVPQDQRRAAAESREPGAAKSFEAQWQQEGTDPDADRAFAQFFSDKVEADPSQSWILEVEAS